LSPPVQMVLSSGKLPVGPFWGCLKLTGRSHTHTHTHTHVDVVQSKAMIKSIE
jgi:hypothetical protein